MTKSILKFALLGLLLICLIAIPLVGVHYYDSPSVFEEGAIAMNRDFGKSTSAYLSFPAESNVDLQKATEILKSRLSTVGHSDCSVTVEDDLIRIDLAQTDFINSVLDYVAVPGVWALNDLSGNTLADKNSIASSKVVSQSGSYFLLLNLNAEASSKLSSNSSFATDSSTGYTFFMLDGDYFGNGLCQAQRDGNSLYVGPFDASSAMFVSSLIEKGELGGTPELVKAEPIPASLSAIMAPLFIGCALLLVILCAILIIKGKACGIFASAAVAATASVLLIALANSSFLFCIETLIAIMLVLILVWAFQFYTVSKLAVERKGGKTVSYAVAKVLPKASIKALWIHLALFVVAVVCWMFARGMFYQIVMCALLGVCASAVNFFLFTYFGAKTLAETENKE